MLRLLAVFTLLCAVIVPAKAQECYPTGSTVGWYTNPTDCTLHWSLYQTDVVPNVLINSGAIAPGHMFCLVVPNEPSLCGHTFTFTMFDCQGNPVAPLTFCVSCE